VSACQCQINASIELAALYKITESRARESKKAGEGFHVEDLHTASRGGLGAVEDCCGHVEGCRVPVVFAPCGECRALRSAVFVVQVVRAGLCQDLLE